jgi:hypothetical protein
MAPRNLPFSDQNQLLDFCLVTMHPTAFPRKGGFFSWIDQFTKSAFVSHKYLNIQ